MAKETSLLDQITALDCTPEVKASLMDAVNVYTSELAKQIADLSSENEALSKALEAAKETVEDLSVEYPTFKSKESTFELLVPRFIFEGEEIESKKAVKNATLMAKIIKAAPGFLRKV